MILINGTEGEPGSAKDKMLLLRSPYLVLGGALLAGRALGAKMIVVGVTNGSVAASVAEAAAQSRTSRRSSASSRSRTVRVG